MNDVIPVAPQANALTPGQVALIVEGPSVTVYVADGDEQKPLTPLAQAIIYAASYCASDMDFLKECIRIGRERRKKAN